MISTNTTISPALPDLIKECKRAAGVIRQKVLYMTKQAGSIGAHVGGSLSMVEIMAVLYKAVLKYDKSNPLCETRDRFILSKGHGVIAQYAAMNVEGILSDEELSTFKSNSTRLYAHPSMNMDIGIEFSSGSLGQGLSLGVGTALALKRKKNYTSRVFVLIGDGESNEGQIWEAAMAAAHFKLDNLVVIVDKNQLQYDGSTAEVLNMFDMQKKWEAFGFDALQINGHSAEALISAFSTRTDKPLAIIAETIKGKGVSFMENNPVWHNNRLTQAEYEQALAETGGAL